MEMKNNLPKGWVECSIGEILTAKKGKKPASTIDEPREGYVPYILIDEMEGKQIRTYTNDPKVSIIDETEVLLVWDGSIGKCGSGLKGAIGSTLVGLKALGGIQTKFLEYTIRQQNNFIKETSTGTGLQHINKDFFEICKIPLPPLAEQHRIVAKLDALFEKIENNKQRLEKIPKLLKRFRQSVLAAAVSGKLTEEWREKNKNIECVDLILDKINKEKIKYVKKIKEYIPVSEYETIELPDTWRLGRWDNYLDFSDNPFRRGPFGSVLKKEIFISSGYKIYEQYCPINDDCSFARYFIDEKKYNELKNFAVKAGDFLISCSGVTLGRITQVPDKFDDGIINQAILRVRINQKYFDSKFFLLLFRSPYFQRNIFENSTGSAIPNVKGVEELKSIPAPILSLEEQKEIVHRVEQLFAFADKIEARYTKAKAMLDKLPQSILAKAFRGELVAQDPNDEPASVLLERIKAEKEKLAAEKKLIRQAQGKGKKTKEYSIEEKSVKIAAEKKINYKNKKK